MPVTTDYWYQIQMAASLKLNRTKMKHPYDAAVEENHDLLFFPNTSPVHILQRWGWVGHSPCAGKKMVSLAGAKYNIHCFQSKFETPTAFLQFYLFCGGGVQKKVLRWSWILPPVSLEFLLSKCDGSVLQRIHLLCCSGTLLTCWGIISLLSVQRKGHKAWWIAWSMQIENSPCHSVTLTACFRARWSAIISLSTVHNGFTCSGL